GGAADDLPAGVGGRAAAARAERDRDLDRAAAAAALERHLAIGRAAAARGTGGPVLLAGDRFFETLRPDDVAERDRDLSHRCGEVRGADVSDDAVLAEGVGPLLDAHAGIREHVGAPRARVLDGRLVFARA